MEVPDVVQARLDGDERVYAGVPLGDEDVACLTPSRTLVYRGEGLLSDESVETYPHSIEQLSLSRGRRKAKFGFEYVDGTRTLKVPVGRADGLLERLLEAIFRQQGVVDPEEKVVGSFRFSELTVVVTERRLVKRIGEAVWGDDFEVYRFADVSGLDFEPGSVATQIVIEANGRRQRIKAPNEEAPLVKRTLTNALFDFYDVRNIDEFRATVADDAPTQTDESAEDSNVEFGSGIDPLVSDDTADEPGEWSMDQAREDTRDADQQTGGPPQQDTATADQHADSTGVQADTSPESTAQPTEERRTDQSPQSADPRADTAGSQERRRGQQADDHQRSQQSTDEWGQPPGDARTEPSDASTGAQPEDATRQSSSGDHASQQSDRTPTSDERSRGGRQDGRSESATANEQPRTDDPASVVEQAGQSETSLGKGDRTEPATKEDLAAITQQLSDLTDAVERQNELIEKQHHALKRLLQDRQ